MPIRCCPDGATSTRLTVPVPRRRIPMKPEVVKSNGISARTVSLRVTVRTPALRGELKVTVILAVPGVGRTAGSLTREVAAGAVLGR